MTCLSSLRDRAIIKAVFEVTLLSLERSGSKFLALDLKGSFPTNPGEIRKLRRRLLEAA